MFYPFFFFWSKFLDTRITLSIWILGIMDTHLFNGHVVLFVDLTPQPGIEPRPRHCEHGVVTTEPPGTSLDVRLYYA